MLETSRTSPRTLNLVQMSWEKGGSPSGFAEALSEVRPNLDLALRASSAAHFSRGTAWEQPCNVDGKAHNTRVPVYVRIAARR